MSSMTKTSLWEQARIEGLLKAEAKALRKKTPLKVRSPKDLAWYLSRGWKVVSHQQRTYGSAQHWLLLPE